MNSKKNNERLMQLAEMAKSAMAHRGSHRVLEFMYEMLMQGRVASINGIIEEAICKFGQAYTRELPTKLRRGRMQHCFMNAFKYADIGEGVYIEGFALTSERLVHHAWISRDGVGAVEVTWERKTSADYYGIPISHKLRNQFVMKTRKPGFLFDEDFLPIKEVMRCLAA